jgi:hypothetical protein
MSPTTSLVLKDCTLRDAPSSQRASDPGEDENKSDLGSVRGLVKVDQEHVTEACNAGM